MNSNILTIDGNNDIKVDLHIHTTASDGTWTPSELVDNILKAEIKAFAVTDHDCTSNINETAELARSKGLAFVPGVEINTKYKGRNYHILGLGIDPVNTELQVLLNKNRKMMYDLDYKSMEFLEKAHPEISVAEFQKYVHPSERGGWKALSYTIDKGLCASYKEFLKLFEDYNSFGELDFPSPKEAIAAIITAGGVPILAHPGAEFYDSDYKSIVSSMIEEGIKGIECYHPNNSQEITEYCLDVCKSQGLLVTGGSDCHGTFNSKRYLGYPDVNLSQLKLDGIKILK